MILESSFFAGKMTHYLEQKAAPVISAQVFILNLFSHLVLGLKRMV